MDSTRSWGDGVGRTAEHIIGDIQFSEKPLAVLCGVDGEYIEARTSEGLERAWDLHRGLTAETIRARQTRYAKATDSEVSEFLKRVDDPRYVSHYGPESVTPTNDGLEDAFELMARLRAAGNDCTCATVSVMACPNYVDGDEDNDA